MNSNQMNQSMNNPYIMYNNNQNNISNNSNFNNNQFNYQNNNNYVSLQNLNGFNNYGSNNFNQNKINNLQYNSKIPNYYLRKGKGILYNDEISNFIIEICKKAIDNCIKSNDEKIKLIQADHIIKYLKKLINGEWFVFICESSLDNFDFKFSHINEENVLIFSYKNYEIYICLLYLSIKISMNFNNNSIIDYGINKNEDYIKNENESGNNNKKETIIKNNDSNIINSKANINKNKDNKYIKNIINKKDIYDNIKKNMDLNLDENNNWSHKTINPISTFRSFRVNISGQDDNDKNIENKNNNNINNIHKINTKNKDKNNNENIQQNKYINSNDKNNNKNNNENIPKNINNNKNYNENFNKNKEISKDNKNINNLEKNINNNQKIIEAKVTKNIGISLEKEKNNNKIKDENKKFINKYNIRNFYKEKKNEPKNNNHNIIIINHRNNKIEESKEKINENDNKPDDIIEISKINYYREDIPVKNTKIEKDKKLYDNLQKRIKRILSNRRLPQFKLDNYTKQKSIGEGTYGELFFVINKNNKKKYAIKKQIAENFNTFNDYLKTFEINFKNKHANILDIYGIYVEIIDEQKFFIYALMDLAECDWEQEIERRKGSQRYYMENELISILKQLVNALSFLQKRNIAHRDIKLENILLFPKKGQNFRNSEKIYKICDFGEAKQKIKYNTNHNTVRGSDYYMSPELLKGLNKNNYYVRNNPHKSDVFSLGCCMIIAATLNYEFIENIRNENEQEEINNIIKETLENYYSDKLIDTIIKMIAYNEKERIDFIDLEKLINKEFI